MRRLGRWAAAALVAFAVAAPSSAQVDVVSPSWRVYDAATDSTISFNSELENAIERAFDYWLATGREAHMLPVGPWRVEVDAPWPGDAPADTVFVPGDTVFVRSDTTVVVLLLPDTVPTGGS